MEIKINKYKFDNVELTKSMKFNEFHYKAVKEVRENRYVEFRHMHPSELGDDGKKYLDACYELVAFGILDTDDDAWHTTFIKANNVDNSELFGI